jgi:hypothetical protein
MVRAIVSGRPGISFGVVGVGGAVGFVAASSMPSINDRFEG